MRLKAPQHVTGATISAGIFNVDENGILTVPDEIPTSDIGGLQANGFERLPDEPAKAAPKAAATESKG